MTPSQHQCGDHPASPPRKSSPPLFPNKSTPPPFGLRLLPPFPARRKKQKKNIYIYIQKRPEACVYIYIYIYACRTPQLVGNFEALRSIEAEEKRKNKAEKGKRREKREKRKINLQPQLSVAVSCGHFFTVKLGKHAKNALYLPMK